MSLTVDKTFLDFLHSTFTIKRKTRTPDGIGGFNLTYPTVATIIGKLDPVTPREVVIAGKFSGYVTHILYTLHGVNIQRHDIVEGEGRRVRVIVVREPSEMAHHYEINCEEIQ